MVEIQKFRVPGDAYTHIRDIMSILKAKRQGSGAYATTWRASTKEVIKVFSDDRGYEYYLKAIAKMQDNPFVPCINYIHKYSGSCGQHYYMVSMEMLASYSVLEDCDEFLNFRDLVRECVGDDYDNESLGFADLPDYVKEVAIPQSLIDVMNVIQKGNHDGMGFDLHTGNIMVRDGIDFVITDPLVY